MQLVCPSLPPSLHKAVDQFAMLQGLAAAANTLTGLHACMQGQGKDATDDNKGAQVIVRCYAHHSAVAKIPRHTSP